MIPLHSLCNTRTLNLSSLQTLDRHSDYNEIWTEVELSETLNLLSGVHASPELATSLRTLLSGTSRLPLDHFYRLRSAGIIAGESADAVSLRCRLYQDDFARHLNS